MLVHESELKQVDRCFTFGDFVKRDLASALSGTVISVSVSVGLQHCYDFETPGHSGPIVHNILNSDLVKVSEFKPQQFVIYQDTWMGVIEEVYEDVSLRLQNGSVVMVHDPLALEIPPRSWSTDSNVGREETAGENEARGYNDLPPDAAGPIASTIRIAPPISIPVLGPRTIGMMVKTAKSNLRKGRWLFGSYNPSIPPIGQIVEAKTSRISVNWLYQNMMVAGRFVQKPVPERWLEGDEEMSQLAVFQKSFSGLCKLDGTPFSNIFECGGAGEELQVGAAVRFHNIDDAVRKYGVRKIRRSEAMGFDLNSFVITETRTTVRVQWQDLTETVEDACQLMPYLNVDEHEVWPGEIVIVKEPDTASLSITRNGRASAIMKPNNVGVVQSVDAERVARIRWYAEPRVLIQEGAMVPGSKPGQLSEDPAEEASLYEVIAHQAFAVRRGDYVLIAPEKFNDLRRVGTILLGARRRGTATIQALDGSEIRLSPSDTLQLPGEGQGNLNEQVRDTIERGLLPRFGVVPPDAVPTTFPQGPDDIQPEPAPSEPTSSESVNVPLVEPEAHVYEPLEWIGEVIDLGTDGLITVRLSAMKELRDVKVFIERLHVIFNASSPADIDDDDDDDDDDEYDSDTDDDDSDVWAGDAMVIEQQIFYEGGERVANDGGEEDWLTDDEGRGMDIDEDDDDDDSDSEGMPDLVDVLQREPAQDIEIEEAGGIKVGVIEMDSVEMVEKIDGGKDNVRLKETEPEEEQPALKAFSIPTGKNQPERFAVLGTAVPSDHAFASQAPVPLRPAFARRINKEHQVLSTSLPDGVFVRAFESRLDLMRVLIIGPMDTPYELAPFVFDFYFPATFPHTPPRAYFHSWTAGIGRVNPNLYEDGKICLSLLGTWHAERKAEGWTVGSSILQLLVSLMGLVLVREPYYNEAGFSIFTGTPEAALSSRLYSEKAYALSRRFVNHALENPVSGLEEEIKWLYFGGPGPDGEAGGAGLLKQLIQITRAAIERTSTFVAEGSDNDADVANEGFVKFSGGALVLLRKSLASYEKIWEKFVEDNAGIVVESLRVGEVPAESTS